MSENVIDVRDLVITYKTVQRSSLLHFLQPGRKRKKEEKDEKEKVILPSSFPIKASIR